MFILSLHMMTTYQCHESLSFTFFQGLNSTDLSPCTEYDTDALPSTDTLCRIVCGPALSPFRLPSPCHETVANSSTILLHNICLPQLYLYIGCKVVIGKACSLKMDLYVAQVQVQSAPHASLIKNCALTPNSNIPSRRQLVRTAVDETNLCTWLAIFSKTLRSWECWLTKHYTRPPANRWP